MMVTDCLLPFYHLRETADFFVPNIEKFSKKNARIKEKIKKRTVINKICLQTFFIFHKVNQIEVRQRPDRPRIGRYLPGGQPLQSFLIWFLALLIFHVFVNTEKIQIKQTTSKQTACINQLQCIIDIKIVFLHHFYRNFNQHQHCQCRSLGVQSDRNSDNNGNIFLSSL